MNERPQVTTDFNTGAARRELDQFRKRFEAAWRSGDRPGLEHFLTLCPEADRSDLLAILLPIELAYRHRAGDRPSLTEYQQRFPEHLVQLRSLFDRDNDRWLQGILDRCGDVLPAASPAAETTGGAKHSSDPAPPPENAADDPDVRSGWIGRYRVERLLGKGGFGLVYLAYDEQLHRRVAIKVPRGKRVATAADAEPYLAEARAVAHLDHPHIVPIYDISTTEGVPCFFVSKYIEGQSLAQKLKQERLTAAAAADLAATVAETLHHAHRKGLVHRDIKPGNILLDGEGRPHVADFGLALREEDVGRGSKYAGTPAYMSPEQARGEGHRVDGRADVFSLGVVLYELLAGRPPFRADSIPELLEQITTFEPRPLRQIDDRVPKELERICFKAMAKRAADRYMTAQDLADDLRHFLTQPDSSASTASAARAAPATEPLPTPVGTASSSASPPSSRFQPVRIVPKGLRAFDAHDADFFLELLPGPRDRDGLPDAIRFWKTKIEDHDPDRTFAVGLIYGPSGCGKSSLVRAGLVPRLDPEVLVVYVEATAGETEDRLLSGLRKRCPALPANLVLREMLAALRRGVGLAAGEKVLLVLDQFEQYLHGRPDPEAAELVQALRQCDGGRVQCLVLVRDDFWMAATRFMRELEIRLVGGQNSAAVDLFPVRHAEKILAAFGRSFGALPEGPSELSKEQKAFLDQAVAGLAKDGKVICVRLALFAEMMKGKAWVPRTLQEVGGIEGIGAAFLEDTFSASTAPPEHRLHQKAARPVLRALLPEADTDIKGRMRPAAELLAASGYAGQPREFDDLIRMLDSELRLITPTDPAGRDLDGDSSAEQPVGKRHYQLAHDYLVPALRDWLTRKQKETRRGRAELLLADRAGMWSARKETRQLPTFFQWLSIRLFTRRKTWTELQRQMMRRAGRNFGLKAMVATAVVVVIGVAAVIKHQRDESFDNLTRAAALVQRTISAKLDQVPAIASELGPYREWADPMLAEIFRSVPEGTEKKLNASLALLPADPGQVSFIRERFLDAEPEAVAVLRDALAPYKGELVGGYWEIVEHPASAPPHQQLRAAAGLAAYDPDSLRWAAVSTPVANDLAAVPSVYLSVWLEALRPVKGHLLSPLDGIWRGANRSEVERNSAFETMVAYASDRPQLVVDWLMDAEPKAFAVLFAKLLDHGDTGRRVLLAEFEKPLAPTASRDDKELYAKHQANLSVALMRLNEAAMVWPRLKHSPDPRGRSYLIHRFAPLNADPRALIERLKVEPDVTIRRALIQSLGEFTEAQFPAAEREKLLPLLKQWFRTDPDPGVHGSIMWLLRTWEKWSDLWALTKELATEGKAELDRITRDLARDKANVKPRWFVNTRHLTMVVIPEPGTVLIGSSDSEVGREPGIFERQTEKRITRTFAISATEATVFDYGHFRSGVPYSREYSPDDLSPMNTISWYDAVAYCNWLSKEEGLEPCYVPNKDGQYGPGMRVRPDYLMLTGYRLPTEAEWETACRSGTVTSRYYGDTKELLPKYANYLSTPTKKRTSSVGQLKPNEFGLSDMLGNVTEWCADPGTGPYEPGDDKIPVSDLSGISDDIWRIRRGGCATYDSSYVRSASRVDRDSPNTARIESGFRVARTIR